MIHYAVVVVVVELELDVEDEDEVVVDELDVVELDVVELDVVVELEVVVVVDEVDRVPAPLKESCRVFAKSRSLGRRIFIASVQSKSLDCPITTPFHPMLSWWWLW